LAAESSRRNNANKAVSNFSVINIHKGSCNREGIAVNRWRSQKRSEIEIVVNRSVQTRFQFKEALSQLGELKVNLFHISNQK
jgi:hypothetical protein